MKNSGTTYNHTDILRYVNGEMSPEEMRHLELASVDDAFLADAIEGYKNAKPDVAEKHHRLVEAYVRNQTDSKKIIPLYRSPLLRIAAILLLVAGAAWLSITLLTDTKNELAVVPARKDSVERVAKKDSIPASAPSESIANTSTTSESEKIAEEKDIVRPKRSLEGAIKENKEIAETSAIAGRMRQQNETAPATIAPNALQGKVQGVQIQDNGKRIDRITIRGVNSMSSVNKIGGIVNDEYGNALQNASVTVDNKTVKTDKNGIFMLPASDSNKLATVSADGLNGKQVTLRSGMNHIQLEKNETLAEVVVSASAPVARKRFSGAAVSQPSVSIDTTGITAPKIGWAVFQNRINTAIRKSLGKTISDSTIISFRVSRSGKPRNIRIENTDNSKMAETIKDLIDSEEFWMPSEERIRLVIRIK